MTTWLDRFTGSEYRLSEEQRAAIRAAIAHEIAACAREGKTPKDQANAIAEFWHAYYERVFPLRFGREGVQAGFTTGATLAYASANGALGVPNAAQWRTHFLDEMRYPPILPAETQPSEADSPALLAADHHLITAALMNVCLRRAGADEETVHQARLGALTHELIDLPEVRDLLQGAPLALALAQYLKGEASEPPEALRDHKTLIDAVHGGRADLLPDAYPLCIVGLAAQRIKQYVFETPGLPEIRGASILLDEVVEKAAREVADQLGRECVLQQVASTLIFLAPDAGDWVNQLKRRFYEKTLSAFCAAAAHEVALHQMLDKYSDSMRAFLSALDADRYQAELPVWECLPFEARCAFCRRRAATTLQRTPDGELLSICPVCIIKREKGDADERRKAGEKLLHDAGVVGWQSLLKHPTRAFLGGLNELVPETGESEQKKQVAFIYGDGSNFGRITKNLTSLALSLQWTRRAELVTRAAVALAVSRSIETALAENTTLQRMPFEALVIGGDDFSLFTWSRLALRFCEQFVRLTDLEFEKGDSNQCIVGDTPICFGVGCLISDEKAPVYRVVEFTESQLLKFAKRGVPQHKRGAIAFLFTTNADQIPGDYNDHLRCNYRREARAGKDASGSVPVYLTMQPMTAAELDAFLQCAQQIIDTNQLGSLQRLAEPFVRQPLSAALLHFAYQQARAQNAEDRAAFFDNLLKLRASNGQGATAQLFPIQRLPRITVDSAKPEHNYFAPILDLLEITKSLR